MSLRNCVRAVLLDIRPPPAGGIPIFLSIAGRRGPDGTPVQDRHGISLSGRMPPPPI